MPFRKRPVQDPDAATKELARTHEAMAYWNEKVREASEEITSLQGVFGWLQVFTGGREAAIQAAQERLALAKRNLKKERMAQVAAQQAVEREEKKRQAKKKQADEHLLDLEVLATRVRDSDHPAAVQLDGLETQLDRVENQLQRLADVVAAAGGLHASIGQIERFALQMQTRVLGMIRTPEAISAYRKLPKAILRFSEACIDAGIEPPNLAVPSNVVRQAAMDPMYWVSGDNDWAFYRLRESLLDERDTITLIQMQAARERKEATVERDALHEQRRSLLESLG